MTLYGYARVSTLNQNNDNQVDRLTCYGVSKSNIFQEKASGKSYDRPVLHDCLSKLKTGDVLVICKVDRLARSVSDLCKIATDLSEKGIELRFLDNDLKFSDKYGKFTLQVLAAAAELERELIVERVNEGLAAAKASGTRLGAPLKMTKDKVQRIMKYAEVNNLSNRRALRELRESEASFYRAKKYYDL